jgi:misacylated tRNA(Ala) deacylase
MTKLLYLTDCYLKEFDAKVINAEKNLIELDQTAFYPLGGGQPADKGKIIFNRQEFQVINVFKEKGKVFHQIDKEGLNKNCEVHCLIDWERRYKLMRMHTAAHVLSEIINREAGALITGNQLETEKTRIDFNLESFDRRKIEECVEKANEIIKKDLPVKIYFLKREDAMKIPKITKLANVLPPNLPELRIVEIVGFDLQADGGTHVKSLSEIGEIVLEDIVNKGKNNRRVYYSLKP